MALKVKKSTGSRHIDPGEYVAVVGAIREGSGNYGTYFLWSFIVDNPMEDEEEIDEEVKVTGITSDILSPKSKLGKWCTAAGLDLDSEDEELDIEEAVGEIVRIIVEDDESDDGNVYSKVKLVMKPRKSTKKGKKGKKGKKAKKPDPVEDEDDGDDDEDEKPKKPKKNKKDKKNKKGKKKAKKPEPEDDDDDEDDAPPDDDNDDDDDLFNFDDDDDEDD